MSEQIAHHGIGELKVVIKADTDKIIHLDRHCLTDKFTEAGDTWYDLAIAVARRLEISVDPKRNETLREFMAGLADYFIILRDNKQLGEPAEDIRLLSTLFRERSQDEFLTEGAIALANADLIEPALSMLSSDPGADQPCVAERDYSRVLIAAAASRARQGDKAEAFDYLMSAFSASKYGSSVNYGLNPSHLEAINRCLSDGLEAETEI